MRITQFYLIILLIVIVSCSKNNPKVKNNDDSTKVIQEDAKPRQEFAFLGEKVGRKENFDTNIVVTLGNLDVYYRHYNISKVFTMQNTGIYKIESEKIYSDARYLSRLLRMEDGKQTAAITFYDYQIDFIESQNGNIIVGLNSLMYSGPKYPSCFCCKIVILTKSLDVKAERKFKYSDLEYTYIDTLYLTEKGFDVGINDIGFDHDHYYRYIANFNKDGVIYASSKSLQWHDKVNEPH